MKRPENFDDMMKTLPRELVAYVSFLEGWKTATTATMAKVAAGQVHSKKSVAYADLCKSCVHSMKIGAPAGSDKKFLILCKEPTYGQGRNLVQQARQLGPCGPEASLRQTPEEQPEATLHGIPEKEIQGTAVTP